MGCGNGYWTLPIARKVGQQGRVLAVDIQREMLQKLQARAGKAKIKNMEPILGKIDDPNLPAAEVDLLLMVDVYHEFSHPESMLWSIRRSSKAEGVVGLLEYREEDPSCADQTASQDVQESDHQRIPAERIQAGPRVQQSALAAPDVLCPRRQPAPSDRTVAHATGAPRSGVNFRSPPNPPSYDR